MKSITKIVHEIEFGNYRQEWELSFNYDDETVENVKVVANNYENGKFVFSNDIKSVLPNSFIDAMIDSIDILAYEQDKRDNDFLCVSDMLDEITIRP